MTIEYLILVQSVLAALGYVLLFGTIYQIADRSTTKKSTVRIILALTIALLGPANLLAGGLLVFPSDSILPGQLGRLCSTAWFPWLSLIPTLIAVSIIIWLQAMAGRQEEKNPVAVSPDQTAIGMNGEKVGTILAAGGCAIPFVLFIATFVILCCMGLHMLNHDYKPAMDGPQPIIRWNGIDMVFLVDFFAPLSFIASFFFFVFAGIVLSKKLKKPTVEPKKTLSKLVEFAVVFVIIAALSAFLLPAVQTARESSKRPRCRTTLLQLALAMWNYQDVYGSLPPAYTTDSDGKPLQSWRVLILPFLERKSLYDQIRLNEPWDSEHNRQFWEKETSCYRCAEKMSERRECFLVSHYPAYYLKSTSETPSTQCDYSVLVGPDTLFPGSECRSLSSLSSEEQSRTLLIVERKTPICWMDPTQELANQTDIGSSKHATPNVAYADGSVQPHSTSGK